MNVSLTKGADTKINASTRLNFSSRRRVPTILQSEVSECGLACIAMISSYYGNKTNLISLRKSVNISSQGMNLKQIIQLADDSGLSSRALKCDMENLTDLSLPCILHWNLDHFVVLTGVTKKGIHINDPAYGKRCLSPEVVSQSFTGVALQLYPASNFRVADTRQIMSLNQLWEKSFGFKRTLSALLSLSFVIQGAAIVSPYYMQWVIDHVLLSNDHSMLVVLAVGFTLLLVFQMSVKAFRSWLVLRFSSSLSIQMGANLFSHLLKLPMEYFEKRHVGDIVSRFGSLSSIREMITTGFVEAMIDGFMSVVVLCMMYLYSPLLASIVTVVVLLSFFMQVVFYYPNRRIIEESIVAEAKEDSTFLESVRAMQTIKLFCQESSRQSSWLNRYADVINSSIRLGKLAIVEETLRDTLLGVTLIIIVYIGAHSVMEGQLTLGMLLAFIAYKTQFISSTNALIDNLLSFKLFSLHLERISDITLQDKERQVDSGQQLLPKDIKGHVRLENICFRYSDNSDWVLENISLEIMPGENVALIGSSGSGKSTLLKIILGILKPTSGKVYLDNVDVTDVCLREYRSHFGSVMQNDTLLSGTLAENITLFDANYDEEWLIECCRRACIWDEIESLPMGLSSLVGDMGSFFSGGQVQRILLARALYKSPRILCLDESTSHLDQQNERRINDNLGELEVTKILVAHRKETIKTCQRIIHV